MPLSVNCEFVGVMKDYKMSRCTNSQCLSA